MTLYEFIDGIMEGRLPIPPHLERCYLCGARPSTIGVFLPTCPAMYPGGPVLPGKARAIFYALCNLCQRRSDRVAAIEAKMAAHVKGSIH